MTEGSGAAADMTFGEAINRIEVIVASLESGQLDLEGSLAMYEEGVMLMRVVQNKLTDAQQRVTMLIGELESEVEDVPGSVD